jgi:diguanylate cyclase (GGDEF)-like protein
MGIPPPGQVIPWSTIAPAEGRAGLSLALIGFALIGLVGFIDYSTGPALSVAIFYLIPVALGSWRGGFSWGLLFSLCSTVVWHFGGVERADTPAVIHVWNDVVHFGFFVITSSLIARLRTAMLREQALARTDPLTGVANGRTFYEEVNRQIQWSDRTCRPLTAAYLDLDNFKQVNDRLGHSVGDELLCKVAHVIRKNTRTIDIIARLGGDEFAILLPETAAAGAATWLYKLRAALVREIAEGHWPVTCSLGAATFLRPPQDVDALVRRIDALMYEAKRDGKNGCRHVVVEDPDGSVTAGARPRERRAMVRFLCNQPVTIALDGAAEGQNSLATIRNISRTGIGVYLESLLPESALVTVEPLAQTSAKTLLARVVYSRPDCKGWYHGCELSTMLSDAELSYWVS